jgi:Holliday junction DNA helicase RuvA
VISYIKGILKEVGEESFLLSVNDVGYEVFATSLFLNELESCWGKVVEVWTYTHVREDILQLYGFPRQEEKSFFLNLLKINGVGPKSAMHVLGGASLSQLHDMIEGEDVKALSKLPKVGKKTAEQMILSLKGKLVRLDQNGNGSEKKSMLPRMSQNLQLVASALTNLGYRPQDVTELLQDFPSEIDLQEGVRRGLQVLAKQI